MKYARNRDGCWIDVWTVPGDFPDLATLTKCLPGDPFVQVDDAVTHGDFVVGEAGFNPRPAVDDATPDAYDTPDVGQILQQLSQKIDALDSKVDALTPPDPPA